MCPQWIPQNIQKRLLLYVLQQLSLFSEIDFPNLEEVSLNNIVLKSVSIDPEKVGKIPGCNLRYGQVATLELNRVNSGVVTIDADGVDLVIAPDFDFNKEKSEQSSFLLAKSTADLANTIIEDEDEEEENLTGNTDGLEKDNQGMPSSSSSTSSGKARPSAFTSVMNKAMELALLRLQIKISNISLKIISELTDFMVKIDIITFNNDDGIRKLKAQGIRLQNLKPAGNNTHSYQSSANNSATENTSAEEYKSDSSLNDSDTNNDDYDKPNDFGDESLMNSMVFTHEEASSIYMSANSQTFKSSGKQSKQSETTHSSSSPANLLYIDELNLEFEGLSQINDLKIDISDVKVSFLSVIPALLDILESLTRNLKLKNLQRKKDLFSKNTLKTNTRFPQYTASDEVIESNEDYLSDEGTDSNLFLNKLHINKVSMSTDSMLDSSGEFIPLAGNVIFVFENFYIKHRNENLVYGGVEVFKMIKEEELRNINVFSFTKLGEPDTKTVTSDVPNLHSKADIRFEYCKEKPSSDFAELIFLLSKHAEILLDSQSISALASFGSSIASALHSYKSMKSCLDFYFNLSAKKIPLQQKTDNNIEFQSALQTSSFSVKIPMNNSSNLEFFCYPVSFNSKRGDLSIDKLLAYSLIEGEKRTILKVHNINLGVYEKEFRTHQDRNPKTSHYSPLDTLISKCSLVVKYVKFSMDFEDLLIMQSELLLLFNSLKSSSKIGTRHNKKPRGRIPETSILQASSMINQRKSVRINYDNPSYVTRGNTFSSFRVVINNLDLEILNILPKFGGFCVSLNRIEGYEHNSEIKVSVNTFKVERTENDDMGKILAYDAMQTFSKTSNFPMISLTFKKGDNHGHITVILRNVLVEYFSKWLELLERDLDENMVLNDIAENRLESSNPESNFLLNNFDIRCAFENCALGLNPGRLPCKSYISFKSASSDLTFALHQIYVKSSFRDVSILLVDNVKNLDDTRAKGSGNMSLPDHLSISSQLISRGYVSVGDINCTHIGVTINTNVQALIERNSKMGLFEDISVLDIKINSDEHQIDLCADSAYAMSQLLNDLKSPVVFTDEEKVKIKLDNEIDLLEQVDLDFFKEKQEIFAEGPKETPNREDSEDASFDIVDEYYDLQNPLSSVEDEMKNLNLIDSSNGQCSESDFTFEENHFSKANNSTDNVKIFPIKFNINFSKVNVYLYDGYDWKDTRKAIKRAVKRVEASIQENKKDTPLDGNSDQSTEMLDSISDHSRNPKPKVSAPGEEGLVGETLFLSIQVTLPKHSDPVNLTKSINNLLQNSSSEGPSADSKSLSNLIAGKYYKSLRLRRSKHHKVLFNLKNTEINMTIFSTRDPRKESPSPNIPFEIINSLELRVENIDVFDNIPTSSWNKMLSYMSIMGEKEIGTNILNLKLTNLRSTPELCTSEFMVNVSLLPLRLHLDQDALDFLLRFFEFKDDALELPNDDLLYLQSFNISELKLKLDYKPKKIDYTGMQSGNAAALVNFFILDGSELTLPSLRVYGLSGIPGLALALKDAWFPYIRKYQIGGLVSGVSPIKTAVNLTEGIKDLFLVPIQEYQKDGRIGRSLQKGTMVFAKVTGSELLRLGTKLASGTQVLLEQSEEVFGGEGRGIRMPNNSLTRTNYLADDTSVNSQLLGRGDPPKDLLYQSQILKGNSELENEQFLNKRLYSYAEFDDADDVDETILKNSLLVMNPKYSKQSEFSNLGDLLVDANSDATLASEDSDAEDEKEGFKLVSLYSNQPENAKEGISSAYKSLERNMKATKDSLDKLRKDINNSPNLQDALRSILKSSPVLVIRPMIGTTEALLKTLMGFRNEIDSKQLVESQDKYRYKKPPEGHQ